MGFSDIFYIILNGSFKNSSYAELFRKIQNFFLAHFEWLSVGFINDVFWLKF